MDIDSMPAGPQIDALVAERVMGDIWRHDRGHWIKGDLQLSADLKMVTSASGNSGSILSQPPPFSTDITAAWEVVNELASLGRRDKLHAVRVELMLSQDPGYEWRCHALGIEAFANTAPLAICRAALKATSL